VDADNNGTYETTATIGEGQTHLFSGLSAGARIRSSAPVQVHLATGDTTASYESRWVTLFADNDLSDDYMNPAGSASNNSPTFNYIYNPGTTPIVVTATDSAVTPYTIPAGGTA